jgi:MFS family permease
MSLGSLMGLFFVPYIIDMFGRRSGILAGSCIMILGVGLQTGARNFGMFVAARLLIGFGDCIVLGSAPLLITELAPPQDRAVLVTLSGASYHSGAFIASWVTFATLKIPSNWSWRLPSLLQCTFSIIISIAIAFTPESPRWLISKDRSEEALDIIAKYHSISGDRDDKLVQLEIYSRPPETGREWVSSPPSASSHSGTLQFRSHYALEFELMMVTGLEMVSSLTILPQS